MARWLPSRISCAAHRLHTEPIDARYLAARPCRRGHRVKRRNVIALIGILPALGPLAARAQQAALPVVGVLVAGPADRFSRQIDGFRRGLKETGYIEGQNVAIELRAAETDIA